VWANHVVALDSAMLMLEAAEAADMSGMSLRLPSGLPSRGVAAR